VFARNRRSHKRPRFLQNLCHPTICPHLAELGAQGTAVEIALNLIEVTPRRSPPGNEQFSNLFRGPSDPALGQGLYRVLSPSFGAEDLFLVPVGLDPDGARLYEAFVNRMITTQ
jgi:hypothetical protein